VYYVREDIMKRATNISRDQLVSLGVCVGKFTHSDKFRLMIGALELLAAHAKHKVRAHARTLALDSFGDGIRRRQLRGHARTSPCPMIHLFSLQPEFHEDDVILITFSSEGSAVCDSRLLSS
jgi:hypothetical protein